MRRTQEALQTRERAKARQEEQKSKIPPAGALAPVNGSDKPQAQAKAPRTKATSLSQAKKSAAKAGQEAAAQAAAAWCGTQTPADKEIKEEPQMQAEGETKHAVAETEAKPATVAQPQEPVTVVGLPDEPKPLTDAQKRVLWEKERYAILSSTPGAMAFHEDAMARALHGSALERLAKANGLTSHEAARVREEFEIMHRENVMTQASGGSLAKPFDVESRGIDPAAGERNPEEASAETGQTVSAQDGAPAQPTVTGETTSAETQEGKGPDSGGEDAAEDPAWADEAAQASVSDVEAEKIEEKEEQEGKDEAVEGEEPQTQDHQETAEAPESVPTEQEVAKPAPKSEAQPIAAVAPEPEKEAKLVEPTAAPQGKRTEEPDPDSEALSPPVDAMVREEQERRRRWEEERNVNEEIGRRESENARLACEGIRADVRREREEARWFNRARRLCSRLWGQSAVTKTSRGFVWTRTLVGVGVAAVIGCALWVTRPVGVSVAVIWRTATESVSAVVPSLRNPFVGPRLAVADRRGAHEALRVLAQTENLATLLATQEAYEDLFLAACASVAGRERLIVLDARAVIASSDAEETDVTPLITAEIVRLVRAGFLKAKTPEPAAGKDSPSDEKDKDIPADEKPVSDSEGEKR